MVAVVLGASFLAAYPLPVLLVGAFGVAAWAITTLHDYVTVTRARLRQRADYEHYLLLRGDPRGFYGRYSPTPIERKP
jgi:hypothetical protein